MFVSHVHMKESAKQKLKQKTELKVVEQKIQNASPQLISHIDHFLETIVPLEETYNTIQRLAEEQGLTPNMLKALFVARAKALDIQRPELLKKANTMFPNTKALMARRDRSDKGVSKNKDNDPTTDDQSDSDIQTDSDENRDQGSEPSNEVDQAAIVKVRMNMSNVNRNNLSSLAKKASVIEFDLLEGYLINFRQIS